MKMKLYCVKQMYPAKRKRNRKRCLRCPVFLKTLRVNKSGEVFVEQNCIWKVFNWYIMRHLCKCQFFFSFLPTFPQCLIFCAYTQLLPMFSEHTFSLVECLVVYLVYNWSVWADSSFWQSLPFIWFVFAYTEMYIYM